jgi:hypothetical protein
MEEKLKTPIGEGPADPSSATCGTDVRCFTEQQLSCEKQLKCRYRTRGMGARATVWGGSLPLTSQLA